MESRLEGLNGECCGICRRRDVVEGRTDAPRLPGHRAHRYAHLDSTLSTDFNRSPKEQLATRVSTIRGGRLLLFRRPSPSHTHAWRTYSPCTLSTALYLRVSLYVTLVSTFIVPPHPHLYSRLLIVSFPLLLAPKLLSLLLPNHVLMRRKIQHALCEK